MSDYDDDGEDNDGKDDDDSKDYGEDNSGNFEGDDSAARFTIEFPSIYRIKSRRLLCIQLGQLSDKNLCRHRVPDFR